MTHAWQRYGARMAPQLEGAMRQLSLGFPDAKSIDEAFEEFLRLNPHVLDAFRTAARRLRAQGHKRYSAKGIVEGLRFTASLETVSVDGWKINNNWTSRLARLLIAEDASWGEFFELRTLKSREDHP